MTGWRPIVAFDDDPSPSYVNGFEAGMIWQMIQSGKHEIARTVHAENIGTLQNMANAAGYEMLIDHSADGWADVRLVSRPKRSGLSIIDGGK